MTQARKMVWKLSSLKKCTFFLHLPSIILYLFKFYKLWPNISYPETTSRSLSNKPVAMSRCWPVWQQATDTSQTHNVLRGKDLETKSRNEPNTLVSLNLVTFSFYKTEILLSNRVPVYEIPVEILRQFSHRTTITDDRKSRKLKQHCYFAIAICLRLILLFYYFCIAFCPRFRQALPILKKKKKNFSLFSIPQNSFSSQSLLHPQIPGDFVIQGKHGIQYCKTSLESVKFNKKSRNQRSSSLSRFSKDFIPAP